MRSQSVTKSFRRSANIAIDVRAQEDFRVPRSIGYKLIKFVVKLFLFIDVVRMINRTLKSLITPFAFRWYVSVERFNLLGKQRVNPIIRPGNLESIKEVIGSNFPARVHARASYGHKMIITPALVRPCRCGFSFIP